MKVLFVCTGNTCRSPMCEVWFRELARRAGKDAEIQCASSGLSASGGGASVNARAAVGRDGLSLDSHVSRPFTAALAAEYDLIVPVSPAHGQGVLRIAPEAGPKIRLLSGDGVPDPFGGTLRVYEECYARMKESLQALFNTIFIHEKG